MRLQGKKINKEVNGIRIVFNMSNSLLNIQIEYLKMLIINHRSLQANYWRILQLIYVFIKIINQTLDKIKRVINHPQLSKIIKYAKEKGIAVPSEFEWFYKSRYDLDTMRHAESPSVYSKLRPVLDLPDGFFERLIPQTNSMSFVQIKM